MDINVSPVKTACTKHLQKGLRQCRYLLKKYFKEEILIPKESPVASMNKDEWKALVEHWSDPQTMVSSFQHQSSCLCTFLCLQLLILPFLQKFSEQNKQNRLKVQFHQTTGSRSYEVHLQNLVSQDLSFIGWNTVMDVSNLMSI